MLSSISVYAASISGLMFESTAGQVKFTFLRFCVRRFGWLYEFDKLSSSDSLLEKRGRFEDFPLGLFDEDIFTRGVEVTLRGEAPDLSAESLPPFTGVHPVLVGDPGYEEYISLRSESVPYPLSISATGSRLKGNDFGGGQIGSSEYAEDVRGLTANDGSLDCVRRVVASSLHPRMMARSMLRFSKSGSPFSWHIATKSGPKTGTRTYLIL